MNSRHITYLQIAMAILDILACNILCFAILSLFDEQKGYVSPLSFYSFSIYVSFTWLIVGLMGGIYSRKTILSFLLFTQKTFICILYIGALTAIFSTIYYPFVSLSTMIGGLTCLLFGLIINRFLYFIIYRFFKGRAYLKERVILLGFNSTSKKIATCIEENEINKEVIGFCDEEASVNELSNYPILGNINQTFEVCKQYGVTEIYSSIAPEYNPEIYKIIRLADQHCIHFRFVPDINLFINRPCHVDFWNNMPVLTLRKEPLQELDNRFIKATFDFIFSLLVTVLLLSWLVPIISLIIWIDSGGPIFFTQVRNGKENKKFTCYKFRSMKVNDLADVKQATRNDQRLTKVGKILRHTNLDELPQFINVLKGEMSIVGPRPHMLKHTTEYAEKVNDFMVRHFVKPGITGLAQVNGCRGEIESIEMLRKRVHYDLKYLENWSFWFDIKIILLTITNILKGDKHAF